MQLNNWNKVVGEVIIQIFHAVTWLIMWKYTDKILAKYILLYGNKRNIKIINSTSFLKEKQENTATKQETRAANISVCQLEMNFVKSVQVLRRPHWVGWIHGEAFEHLDRTKHDQLVLEKNWRLISASLTSTVHMKSQEQKVSKG